MIHKQSKDVLNISVPVSYDGFHYQGLSLLDGVTLRFEKAPCQPTDAPVRYMGVIENAKEDVKPFFTDQVSHINDKSKKPVMTYLLLHPKD